MQREKRHVHTNQFGAPSGFTLIELMITVAVMATLAAIAAPSFRSALLSSRARTETSQFASTLGYARSEAIKRGLNVTVCRSVNPDDDAPDCVTAGSGWKGWLVFTDDNGSGTVDGTDARLRVGTAPENISITGSTNFDKYITFSPSGSVSGNGTQLSATETISVDVQPSVTPATVGEKNTQWRCLYVNTLGRIRINKGACI